MVEMGHMDDAVVWAIVHRRLSRVSVQMAKYHTPPILTTMPPIRGVGLETSVLMLAGLMPALPLRCDTGH